MKPKNLYLIFSITFLAGFIFTFVPWMSVENKFIPAVLFTFIFFPYIYSYRGLLKLNGMNTPFNILIAIMGGINGLSNLIIFISTWSIALDKIL